MSSYPLPALSVHGPDPNQGMNNLAMLYQIMQNKQRLQQEQALLPGQIQQQQQNVQSGALENQTKQIQLNDQKAMTAAMQEWDPTKGYDTLPGLVIKNGGSAGAVMSLRKNIIDQEQAHAKLDTDTLANMKSRTDLMLGALDATKEVPDDQFAQHLASTVQDLTQRGVMQPQHAQVAAQLIQGIQSGQIDVPTARKQLDLFEKSQTGLSALQDQALKNAQTQEAQAKTQASTAEAKKTNLESDLIQKYGFANAAQMDSKYVSLLSAQKQGLPISPPDQAFMDGYKSMKMMVPTAVANIRVEGQQQARMYPVYDSTQKNTRYVSAEELTRASSEEPNRYTVASFTPESITQQQTGKTFAPGGKAGEESLAFNTAIAHADLLRQAAKALNNGDTKALNTIKNTLSTQFGDPDLTNFKAIADVYQHEVQKMIAGGHITDAEIASKKATLPDNANYETIDKVLGSYQALAQSKLSLRQKQEQMGKQGQSMVDMPQSNSQTTRQYQGHTYVQQPDGSWKRQ